MRYFLIFALLVTLGAGCTDQQAEFTAPHYDNGIFQSENEILFIGRETIQAEWSTDQAGNLFVTLANQDIKKIPLFAQANVLYVRNGKQLFENSRGQGTINLADALEVKSPQGSTFYIDVLSVVNN
ncbi:hypothetical protein KJ611_00410 [Patescibacteria group bacterium]|nr:hypothetical protein [Patescibacteria group bacterium]MBU1705209.1 hypothetical protein [Patescibacteria group bacterium]